MSMMHSFRSVFEREWKAMFIDLALPDSFTEDEIAETHTRYLRERRVAPDYATVIRSHGRNHTSIWNGSRCVPSSQRSSFLAFERGVTPWSIRINDKDSFFWFDVRRFSKEMKHHLSGPWYTTHERDTVKGVYFTEVDGHSIAVLSEKRPIFDSLEVVCASTDPDLDFVGDWLFKSAIEPMHPQIEDIDEGRFTLPFQTDFMMEL